MDIKSIIRTYLKVMVQNHPFHYSKMVQTFEIVNRYVIENTHKLDYINPKMSQRIEWILKDRKSIPVCHNSKCNKLLDNKRNFMNINNGYVRYCSSKCSNSDQYIKELKFNNRVRKFGSYNPKDFGEKVKNTKMKNHGDTNYVNSQKMLETKRLKLKENPNYYHDIRQKGFNTTEKLYGDRNFNNPEKRHETNLRLYGNRTYVNVDARMNTIRDKLNKNPYYYDEMVQKVKSTKKIKYGKENYQNVEKFKQTCLERYGVEHPMYMQSTKDKIKNTCIKRYNCEHPLQNNKVFVSHFKRYLYKGVNVDSSWELYFMIYMDDKKIKYKYQPDIQLEYVFEDKIYIYHPDFYINGLIVEIKGDQFFRTVNGQTVMICPYGSKGTDRERLNRKFNEKYKCMIRNNVKILTYKDIKQYKKYVNEKYGKKYIKQFLTRV